MMRALLASAKELLAHIDRVAEQAHHDFQLLKTQLVELLVVPLERELQADGERSVRKGGKTTRCRVWR
jgi:hypothetical protein